VHDIQLCDESENVLEIETIATHAPVCLFFVFFNYARRKQNMSVFHLKNLNLLVVTSGYGPAPRVYALYFKHSE